SPLDGRGKQRVVRCSILTRQSYPQENVNNCIFFIDKKTEQDEFQDESIMVNLCLLCSDSIWVAKAYDK
ncbi:MAG: hypothetical protein QM529_06915, partial [Hydrotalea sp.]|nr:hypothetical protein [Hydrotalea sp.]